MAESAAQLELKKRARRRLIGALVLAVTAAVVLPMVMDQEPPSGGEDIQIRIPSQDGGAFISRVVPTIPPAPAPAPAAPGATSGPAGAAGGAEIPEAKPAAPSAPQPAATQNSVQAKAPAEKPAEKKTAAQKPAGTNGTGEKRTQAQGAAEKPASGNGAPSTAKPQSAQAAGGESYILQLGVFASAENVRKVQARVKALGYSVYTEPMEGAPAGRTRVRAGPFASREAAEKARGRLQQAGLAGIVAPRP